MADTAANIDIIRTKLHRPPVTRDLVSRTQLLEQRVILALVVYSFVIDVISL